MVRYLSIHPEAPQPRLLAQVAEILGASGVAAIPTDSCYSLCCKLGDKEAVERIRHIRNVDDRHHLTLMCRDLSEIAQFARVDNAQYRLLKAATPGSYTFILEGTKELPRRVLHPKRKTIGLRIPDHPVAQALLEVLGEPLLTSKNNISWPKDGFLPCGRRRPDSGWDQAYIWVRNVVAQPR